MKKVKELWKEQDANDWEVTWIDLGARGNVLHRIRTGRVLLHDGKQYVIGATLCGYTIKGYTPGMLERMYGTRCQRCVKLYIDLYGSIAGHEGNPYTAKKIDHEL